MMRRYTAEELLIEALTDLMEYSPKLFSLSTQRQVLYRGCEIPDKVFAMVNQGVYHNMLLEIISQAESLKRVILTPEELALSA